MAPPHGVSTAVRLDSVHSAAPEIVASAMVTVDTRGEGLIEITRAAADFLAKIQAGDGVFLAFLCHTSASLAIQENADPDVRTDLTAALRRLAPEDAGWVHEVEGPDDMPAHVEAMLTGVSLHVPVKALARVRIGYSCGQPGRRALSNKEDSTVSSTSAERSLSRAARATTAS